MVRGVVHRLHWFKKSTEKITLVFKIYNINTVIELCVQWFKTKGTHPQHLILFTYQSEAVCAALFSRANALKKSLKIYISKNSSGEKNLK